jgi:hypothetical protein
MAVPVTAPVGLVELTDGVERYQHAWQPLRELDETITVPDENVIA